MLATAIWSVVLLAACTVETTGMQAPLAHDYDGIEWLPLDGPIQQAVILAPGYTAAIENDPETTPAELRDRLRALPEDVRHSMLSEVVIRLRPPERGSVDQPPVVQIYQLDGRELEEPDFTIPDAPLFEASAHDLLTDDEQVTITDPLDIAAGSLIVIRLEPASADGEAWEYAITPGRKPYGGWFAAQESGEISGSLAYSTRFERDVGVGGIVGKAAGRIRDSAASDPAFIVAYLGLSLGMLGATARLTSRAARGA